MTDEETTPPMTWSTELMTVRSVSDEFCSSRTICGARAWPTSRRQIRPSCASFAAPIVSQSPNTESRLRATKSTEVIASRISAVR